MIEIPAGADLRQPQWREEVWQRFYTFHLQHRAHPGGVYYLFPYLREWLEWDDEEALWFAFLNGCTQHPPTSLLLWGVGNRPSQARVVIDYFQRNQANLEIDTDRRHQKHQIPLAIEGYVRLIRRHGSQAAYWQHAAEHGWEGVWEAARAIPTFGRLSAFSYSEYLRIFGYGAECTDLMLGDIPGSRSHRNGLCIVTGREELDWHQSNPAFDGRYPAELIETLTDDAAGLLARARERNAGTDWEHDVGYHTMESALCTYKSWHRENRRYPNVYNDMLYDRLKRTEQRHGRYAVEPFWRAREEYLPAHLRLESTPNDPGCVPVKQNWYRETGEVPMMFIGTDLESGFDKKVAAGEFGVRKR